MCPRGDARRLKALTLRKKELKGTVQSHKDALIVTLWIGGFDVERVMIDQGSGAEIMYLDLYEGLGLTL